MTNYEWLVKQGLGALMDWRSKTCSYCASRDVDGRCVGDSCRSGIEAWLEAPHVEPDSWEKLFDDIQRVGHATHTQDDWIDRARKLAGVE